MDDTGNKKQVSEDNFEDNYSGLALVVDDESIMRKVAAAILSEMGFNVVMANDGEEGLRMFIQHKEEIKLVILDLMMPKISGDEVLLEMKKQNKDIKVLIVSGSKKDERLKSILNYKNVNFIEKPYSFKQLTMAVRALTKESNTN